jgi:hypothetical protein
MRNCCLASAVLGSLFLLLGIAAITVGEGLLRHSCPTQPCLAVLWIQIHKDPELLVRSGIMRRIRIQIRDGEW